MPGVQGDEAGRARSPVRPPTYIQSGPQSTRSGEKGGLVPDYDLIIRQGTIVDGTQVPRFIGDIGIRDGVIAEIGALKNASADRVLDAKGSLFPYLLLCSSK